MLMDQKWRKLKIMEKIDEDEKEVMNTSLWNQPHDEGNMSMGLPTCYQVQMMQ